MNRVDMRKRFVYVMMCVLIVATPAFPGGNEPWPPDQNPERRGGVRYVREMTAEASQHETRLVESLRRITALDGLHFGPAGYLALADGSVPSGGACTAREILVRSMQSGMAFIVEDVSGSESVNFGQIGSCWISLDTGQRSKGYSVWLIRLDFDDFARMEATQDVRESFDPGFTLLHELLHGLGYEDKPVATGVGGCESVLNRARAELGLPLRDQYFGELVFATEVVASVRLRFRAWEGSERKSRTKYMFFMVKSNR
jgi:hypothetical protein